MSSDADQARAMRERLLLLRAAALDDARGLAAWRAFRAEGGDVRHVDRQATSVVPGLWRTLRAHPSDDAQLPLVKGVHRHTWVSNQLAVRDAAAALDTLGRVGIAPVVAGRLSLVLAHHGDLGVRAAGQLELLLAPHELRPAQDALAGRAVTLSTAVLPWRSGTPASWPALEPLSVGASQAQRLAPHGELLRVLAGGAPGEVLWMADAAAVLRASAGLFDWDALVALAARERASAGVLRSLKTLSRALDVQAPEAVLAALGAHDLGARERTAAWAARRPRTRRLIAAAGRVTRRP